MSYSVQFYVSIVDEVKVVSAKVDYLVVGMAIGWHYYEFHNTCIDILVQIVQPASTCY